jgi:hypothetical protein
MNYFGSWIQRLLASIAFGLVVRSNIMWEHVVEQSSYPHGGKEAESGHRRRDQRHLSRTGLPVIYFFL